MKAKSSNLEDCSINWMMYYLEKTLKADSKQFAYYNMSNEMGIQNEDVKRKRVLFSLNVQPRYENVIIDAQIEFYSNSIIFC